MIGLVVHRARVLGKRLAPALNNRFKLVQGGFDAVGVELVIG